LRSMVTGRRLHDAGFSWLGPAEASQPWMGARARVLP
jgi:hypothetical protein